MAPITINKFLEDYPALGTAVKCLFIGTVLVATVASGGIIPTITGGAAVTAGIAAATGVLVANKCCNDIVK